jgi:hypothetical protein
MREQNDVSRLREASNVPQEYRDAAVCAWKRGGVHAQRYADQLERAFVNGATAADRPASVEDMISVLRKRAGSNAYATDTALRALGKLLPQPAEVRKAAEELLSEFLMLIEAHGLRVSRLAGDTTLITLPEGKAVKIAVDKECIFSFANLDHASSSKKVASLVFDYADGKFWGVTDEARREALEVLVETMTQAANQT